MSERVEFRVFRSFVQNQYYGTHRRIYYVSPRPLSSKSVAEQLAAELNAREATITQLTARVAELEGERDRLRAAVEVVIAEERYRLAVFRPGMYQELSLQHQAKLISTWSQFGFVEVRDWDSGSHWWVVNFCMAAIGVEPSSETHICKTCYREWKNHIDSCPVCHSRIANCIAGMRDVTAALTPKPGEGKQ